MVIIIIMWCMYIGNKSVILVTGLQCSCDALFQLYRFFTISLDGTFESRISNHSTRSSSVVTISRPPISSSVKITKRSFQHTAPHLWNKLPHFFVSLIHILVFHLLTTLHKSDPHCHHHHQSLLLFFILNLKYTFFKSFLP